MPSNPPSLLAFLRQARQFLLQSPASQPPPILVIGNPSADLDSFASAILYAYFHSIHSNSRTYIPVLNVPFSAGKELRRQRPEFATTLAVRDKDYYKTGYEDRQRQLSERLFEPDDDRGILEEVITRKDLKRSSMFNGAKLDTILVDWNSLAGDSSDSRISEESVSILGCVDHHMDENFVPPTDEASSNKLEDHPRIITPKAGSCTSLVIQHLQSLSLWLSSPASESQDTTPCYEEAVTVQLALGPILVDTANLTGKGKVFDPDKEAVKLLSSTMGPDWDRQKFYKEVQNAKTRGLELLSVEEILGKDYKEWDIQTSESTTQKLGIASVVLPLKSLIEKCDKDPEPDSFISTLHLFAKSHGLSTVAVMTAFSSKEKSESKATFKRELLIWPVTQPHSKKLAKFPDEKTTEEFGLEDWAEVDGITNEEKKIMCWWQRDVSKSRKQIAPFLRHALG